MGHAAVVFFSRDGSTKRAAEVLANRMGATLVELHEAQASNPLILAAPIWAGNGNPAMNGFLDQADLRGKTVHILTVQADPDHGSSKAVLDHYRRRVVEAGGTVGGTRAITGASPGKTAEEPAIRDALEGWEIG